MKALTHLYTIGYEGKDVTSFINSLKENNIELLVDVRQNPLSRKKFFSKKALAEKLAAQGITYYHDSKLGSPKELREQLKKDNDYKYFFSKIDEYFNRNAELIESLIHIVNEKLSCLMCF